MNNEAYQIRYYTSYSGVNLPLNLVSEIGQEDMRNRNTYFQGCFDQHNRLCICRKIVYGETEFEHRYSYHDNGALKQALISEEDDEFTTLRFDEQGNPV
ncbi:MAG: DUF6156 family protein [Gammaproteobacteria bacterium]